MHHHLRRNCRTLDNAAIFCDVAPQNGDTTGLRVRIVDRTDDLGILIGHAFQILANRLAGRSQQRQVEQVATGQLVHNSRDATCHVQLFDVVRACRCQMAQVGHLGRQLVEQFQIDVNASLVCDCQQVQNGIGRAAERHLTGQRVAECLRGQDITRLDVLFKQLHDLHTGMLCQMDTCCMDSRNGAVARQCHTDGLGQAVHRVCSVHTRAGTAARARAALALHELFLGDQTGLVCADGLEGLGQRDLLTAEVTCQHRTARYQNGRDIQASRCHEHAGHDLVAVGDEHQCVHLVCLCQRLNRVRDQFTGRQRVLHADVTHCNAVAYADRRNDNRRAACHGYTCLDCVCNLIEVNMAGDDLGVSRDNADDRAVHLLIGHTAGTQQRAVGHTRSARGDVITSLRQRDSLL